MKHFNRTWTKCIPERFIQLIRSHGMRPKDVSCLFRHLFDMRHLHGPCIVIFGESCTGKSCILDIFKEFYGKHLGEVAGTSQFSYTRLGNAIILYGDEKNPYTLATAGPLTEPSLRIF